MPATLDDARAAKEVVRDFFLRSLPVAAVGVTRTAGEFAVLVDIASPPDTLLPAPDPTWHVPVIVRFVTGEVRFLAAYSEPVPSHTE